MLAYSLAAASTKRATFPASHVWVEGPADGGGCPINARLACTAGVQWFVSRGGGSGIAPDRPAASIPTAAAAAEFRWD